MNFDQRYKFLTENYRDRIGSAVDHRAGALVIWNFFTRVKIPEYIRDINKHSERAKAKDRAVSAKDKEINNLKKHINNLKRQNAELQREIQPIRESLNTLTAEKSQWLRKQAREKNK